MECIMHFLVTRNEYVTSSTYYFLHRSLLDTYDVEKNHVFLFVLFVLLVLWLLLVVNMVVINGAAALDVDFHMISLAIMHKTRIQSK